MKHDPANFPPFSSPCTQVFAISDTAYKIIYCRNLLFLARVTETLGMISRITSFLIYRRENFDLFLKDEISKTMITDTENSQS